MASPPASAEPSPRGAPAPLGVEVACDCESWRRAVPQAEAVVRRAAAAAWTGVRERPQGDAPELSVLLTDDATLRRLNRDYRGTDAATNVLAFESAAPAAPDAPVLLGDIAVAYGTAAAEAQAAGLSLEHHLVHLIVHGVLHLLGYDHAMDAEAEAMERLEAVILRGLGIADPYRRDASGSPAHQGEP